MNYDDLYSAVVHAGINPSDPEQAPKIVEYAAQHLLCSPVDMQVLLETVMDQIHIEIISGVLQSLKATNSAEGQYAITLAFSNIVNYFRTAATNYAGSHADRIQASLQAYEEELNEADYVSSLIQDRLELQEAS